jgi:nitroreductase
LQAKLQEVVAVANGEAVLQAILARRSIRRFRPDPLPREMVEKLLDAAMAAPSGNNVRPWHFVVVQDAGRRRQLSQVHRWAYMVAEAPLAIAVCADASSTEFWLDDCSAATENILIAAQALGLGGVWIGIHQSAQYQEQVRQALGIPSRYTVHCLLAIGYPAEQKPPHGRHDPAKVHWETW